MSGKTSERRTLTLSKAIQPSEVGDFIAAILDAAGLDRDARVEVLGGALVTEAVRPYWEAGCSADEAHEQLQVDDPELAEVVEAISPALLGRAEARIDGAAAVDVFQSLLRSRD